jgi:hypothetical protein
VVLVGDVVHHRTHEGPVPHVPHRLLLCRHGRTLLPLALLVRRVYFSDLA